MQGGSCLRQPCHCFASPGGAPAQPVEKCVLGAEGRKRQQMPFGKSGKECIGCGGGWRAGATSETGGWGGFLAGHALGIYESGQDGGAVKKRELGSQQWSAWLAVRYPDQQGKEPRSFCRGAATAVAAAPALLRGLGRGCGAFCRLQRCAHAADRREALCGIQMCCSISSRSCSALAPVIIATCWLPL